MANQYLTSEQSLSYFKEITPCVPPVDFATEGKAIEFVSCNVDAVVQELIVDPTAESRALAVGNRPRVKGRRNGTFSVVMKLTGLGSITADGDTAPLTALGEHMASCWGGVHLSKSTTLTGGSATAPVLDSVDLIVPGCMIAVQDISSPEPEHDGFPVCRRVLSVDAGTKVVTLSESLGFTPSDGDLVHATATIYTSAHVLRDAVTAGETWCWYVSLGDNVDMQWRLDGCVHGGKIDGLSLGALPTFTLEGMNAFYAHGSEEGLTYIADLGEREGFPQLTSGLDMTLSIGAVGNTAINLVSPNAVTFDPGISRSKVESIAPKNHKFHGLATYSMTATQSKMDITLAEYQNDYVATLAANDRKRLNLTQPGAGSGAGQGYAIHFPNARLVTVPGKAAVGDNWGVTLGFEAAESNDTTGGSNVDLQKSRFLVALF